MPAGEEPNAGECAILLILFLQTSTDEVFRIQPGPSPTRP